MTGKIVLLSGGVGGAKLALGLSRVLPVGALTIIANTGDDFDHLGLRISPDIDTLLYTLAAVANPDLGWGRKDETWTFMHVLKTLGGPDWFNLGDGDVALHVARTDALRRGISLSMFTADVASNWGIGSRIVPMSNDPVATHVITHDGELGFQDYFVRLRCEPTIIALRFAGAAEAALTPDAIEALCDPDLSAIIIAPSNPYLSIDPILAVPGLTSMMRNSGVPVIAISPIIAGEAVKGPTAKIMAELGVAPSALTIAGHYADKIDGCVIDSRDTALAQDFAIPVAITDTLMKSLDDRERVARTALELADALAPTKRHSA